MLSTLDVVNMLVVDSHMHDDIIFVAPAWETQGNSSYMQPIGHVRLSVQEKELIMRWKRTNPRMVGQMSIVTWSSTQTQASMRLAICVFFWEMCASYQYHIGF